MAAATGDRDARLLEASLTLTVKHELPAVLRRVVELAVGITGARYGAFGTLGPDGTIADQVTTGSGKAPKTPPHPSLEAPVAVAGIPYGLLSVAGKRDAAGFDDGDERALQFLAAQAGIAIENARLFEEAQRRARRLEALREVATGILAGSELEELLDLVARHAMELAGANFAGVVVPGPSEESLVIQAAAGPLAPSLRGRTVPMDASLAGLVIRSGKTEVVADGASDPRTWAPAVNAAGFGPAMFVPLRLHGQPFGTLVVSRPVGEKRFADPDVDLVEAFADQAAVAFEYARAHRELRRLVLLEERERIAKDLHDGAIQALFAVGMGLQATAALTIQPDVARRLENAVAELDRVIGDLRNYIFGLRPGILAGRQLDQALHRLGEEVGERSGVITVVEVDEHVAARLAPRAVQLVQVAREALSNVSRHARATTCRVSLYRREQRAVLEVDDDGRGFDPARVAPGHGLGNLRDRATDLGGSLELESRPAEGTTVRVVIPL